MKTKYILILFLVSILITKPEYAYSADTLRSKGIHEIHKTEQLGKESIGAPGAIYNEPVIIAQKDKIVFGYHPYWAAADAYKNYDYKLLTHLAYFSFEIDTATGYYTTLRGWNTTPVIDYAHKRGVKVVLCVTNFGYKNNTAFLSDTNKQNTFITTIINLLTKYDGDGVNMDLESVSSSQRTNLVDFMKRLYTRVKASLPDAEVSIASPSVDWSKAWDYKTISEYVDYFMVMCYDYYWTSSPSSGPVSPFQGGNYNVTNTVDSYLEAGVPSQKVLMGVPWYGIVWHTDTDKKNSKTLGTGVTYTYNKMKSLASSHSVIFDETYYCPWFTYMEHDTCHQGWYDDSLSLASKYSLAMNKGLGGIGIWAINYAQGSAEIWNGIGQAIFPDNTDIVMEASDSGIELLFNETERSLEISNPKGMDLRIEITSLFGNCIYSGSCDSKYSSLELTELISGMYFAVARYGKTMVVKKFAVVN